VKTKDLTGIYRNLQESTGIHRNLQEFTGNHRKWEEMSVAIEFHARLELIVDRCTFFWISLNFFKFI